MLVFLFLLGAGCCMFLLLIWRVNSGDGPRWLPGEGALSIGAPGFGALSLLWLWLSLRCPDCKTSIAGHVLKHESVGTWLTTLLTLTRCPHCGSSGAGRAGTRS